MAKEPPSFRRIGGKNYILTAYSYDRPGAKLKKFVERVRRGMNGADAKLVKGKSHGKTIRYIYTRFKGRAP